MARTTWDANRCVLSVQFAQDTLPILLEMLEPENFMESGCRVIKHPGACAVCVLNNDCDKLPMHAQCRCRPDRYLLTLD